MVVQSQETAVVPKCATAVAEFFENIRNLTIICYFYSLNGFSTPTLQLSFVKNLLTRFYFQFQLNIYSLFIAIKSN